MKGRYTLNSRGRLRIQRLLDLGWAPGRKLFDDTQGADCRNPDLRVRPADRASTALRPKHIDGAELQGALTWRPL